MTQKHFHIISPTINVRFNNQWKHKAKEIQYIGLFWETLYNVKLSMSERLKYNLFIQSIRREEIGRNHKENLNFREILFYHKDLNYFLLERTKDIFFHPVFLFWKFALHKEQDVTMTIELPWTFNN